LDVAVELRALGFGELYLADLDAITGKQANFALFKRIADKTGFELMVDAGIADVHRAERVLASNVSRVVIGTETLPSLDFVRKVVELFGNKRVVVSLDLMGDKVIGRFELGALKDYRVLLRRFQEAAGVSQIIVLDLARVGSGEGVNLPFLKEVLRTFTGKVFVGGGVRDVGDLLELKELGVFGVLVATALHSGKISLEELRHAELLL
jgi:phosphoribosylformimino-5-aminoimidazole carboxamide ribotide isomerase